MLAYTSKYFNVVAPLVRHALQKRYGYELAKRAYDGARPLYRQLLAACPPVGADNPMAKNLYLSCVFFALYRAAEGDLTPEMLRAAVHDVMSSKLTKLMGGVMDLNRPRDVAALNERLRANAQWVEEHPETKPYTWDYRFGDTRQDTQVQYYFTHCPINDFAREQGLLDVLPIMCEVDYATARMMHGTLMRNFTLATGGPMCDYLIRGDRMGEEAVLLRGATPVQGAAESFNNGFLARALSILGWDGSSHNNENLDIDYTRHVEYLPTTKAVLIARLTARFGEEQGLALWEEAKHIYEGYCSGLPYTGGSKNYQCHALYDSLMCFAYWEAMPEERRETVEEFTETVGLVFNGDAAHAQRNPEWLTANNEGLLRALGVLLKPFCDYSVNRHVQVGEWGNAWQLRINPDHLDDVPLQAVLVGCPVADFAREHGLTHLMPAMCNPDFDSMRELGVHLIRPKTVAMGYDVCDSRFVGDRTELAAATPPRMRADGFLVNGDELA